MKLEIDLCFKSKKWPNHAIQKIKPMLKLVTLEVLKTIKASDLCKTLAFSLLFVSDIEMKKYNSKFKDKACATNVLSFPAENFLKTDLIAKLSLFFLSRYLIEGYMNIAAGRKIIK